ncbi:MAG: alpha/beta hydrolase [Leptolyngbya sp. SIO1D8]|nr:alpha/beta hydrolase [Leptolyngbya sp. SIO1D8]
MPYTNVFRVPHFYTLTEGAARTSKTIVFVHGWLLSQCYWQPVIQRLQDNFQCLSYDLRGFGSSNSQLDERSDDVDGGESQPGDYSLAAYAHDLGRLLETLDLKTVWLVGHSWGGSVALWAAKLFPQRVAGVICVNAGGGVYLPDEFKRFRQAGQQIVRWRPAWLASFPFIAHVFTRLMVFKSLAITWGQQRVTDLLAAHEEAAMGALLASTTEAEVHLLPRVVAGLEQPVYFIAGAEDTVMEEKYVRHLASFHKLFDSPQGNVSVLSQCGHMAMVEQPRALATMIQAILQSDPLSDETFLQPVLS